jgi:hypothetical protein
MTRHPSPRRRHNCPTSRGALTILSTRTWNEKSPLQIYPIQDPLRAKKYPKRRRVRNHKPSNQAKIAQYFHFTFVILDFTFVIEDMQLLQ